MAFNLHLAHVESFAYFKALVAITMQNVGLSMLEYVRIQ